jgi:DNA ligase-associated metallophosphoesterase
MSAEVVIRGERLILRADRSLFWPARRTLCVADLHFGKADAFRAASVPVPGGAAATLDRLDVALRETAAERLIVLGDFWHVREGRTDELLDELAIWRAARAALSIELVRGNHDRAGDPPEGWGDNWLTVALADPPFLFAHHPQPSPDGYLLAGHLHPGVRLIGRGREKLRLPCFWFGAEVGVLAAFGGFTGVAIIEPHPGDRVYAIAEGTVIPIPT